MSQAKVPAWVNMALIPILNITLAFLVSGLVILAIGENPLEAAGYLISGAFGYDEGVGYTL
jgi:simple sugar transport system permease protein